MSAFQDFYQNSVKRRQTILDLERIRVAKARHLRRTIGPLFEQTPGFDFVKSYVKLGYLKMVISDLHKVIIKHSRA